MKLKQKSRKKSFSSSVHNNEKGMILIITIALLAVVALVGTIVVKSTNTDIKISSNYKRARQSLYIAEAGVNRARGNLNTDSSWLSSLPQPGTINVFSGDNSFGSGVYDVKIFENDPSSGKTRIYSAGYVTSNLGTVSTSIVETVVEQTDPFTIFDYATFNCGNLDLKDTGNNLITGGDVYVSGNLDLKGSGNQQIQNGDVYAGGNIGIEDTSSITNGNAFANGNIDVESSADPNIGGNATAGGSISGGGVITGTPTQGASSPVSDLCQGSSLADITLTSDVIQNYRDNADIFIDDNYTFSGSDNYTGIVHITGNFELTGNATFSGNVIFIVDGNAEITGNLTSSPTGSTVTFIVPSGNFEVKGGGSITIDGAILVGTVDPDGSGISGGNIDVKDNSTLTVNGSVIGINGNMDAKTAGGDFTVNYQAPTDSNLFNSGYSVTSWRQVTD